MIVEGTCRWVLVVLPIFIVVVIAFTALVLPR